MFDPLSGAIAFLLTEGIKKLAEFLNAHGIPLEVDSWSALFVAAVVSALIVFFNMQGAKLPASVVEWIPVLVKIILILLEAVGIHATVKRLAFETLEEE